MVKVICMADAEYEINNIVLTVSYKNVDFDLERIASGLEGARYDPEVFSGASYRTSEPQASFLIFASGKANCVGARTVEDAEKAIEVLTDELQNLGFDIGKPEVKVQNMVASVDFHRKFNLEKIARDFHHAEYNPEIFPGLIFRWEDTNITILLFVEGKGTCVGARSIEKIEKAIDWIAETID